MVPQTVYEGLHPGRVTCGAAANDHVFWTGGEDTTVRVWAARAQVRRSVAAICECVCAAVLFGNAFPDI